MLLDGVISPPKKAWLPSSPEWRAWRDAGWPCGFPGKWGGWGQTARWRGWGTWTPGTSSWCRSWYRWDSYASPFHRRTDCRRRPLPAEKCNSVYPISIMGTFLFTVTWGSLLVFSNPKGRHLCTANCLRTARRPLWSPQTLCNINILKPMSTV